MAEGVGFEPTVGFPTLDFESSALNRTQPPFLKKQKKTSNAERSTSNVEWQLRSARVTQIILSGENVDLCVAGLHIVKRPNCADARHGFYCGVREHYLRHFLRKNVTIFILPPATAGLHIVCPLGSHAISSC